MNVSTKNKTDLQKTVVAVSLCVLFLVLSFVFCRFASYPLIIPLFVFFLGLHLYFTRKSGLRLFCQLGLLLVLVVFTAFVINQYTLISYFYVPVAGIAMLTMLLFNDLQLAFMMAFASSVLVSLVLGGDFGMMLIFFLGGLTGAYGVREARTRGQLFGAGLFVGVVHLAAMFLLYPEINFLLTQDYSMSYVYPLASNGLLSAFLVLATLKIFEYIFGVLTNYSLLELSDFNQPLLKKMILEAPGTYHHSLIVSNLAEAAADAIGAKALLTRVGAYYHDIGKLEKPEYFTENQLMGGNIHERIEPSMSRLVILNHVKEGVELAKKNKLNPAIIDFIPQHHGTSLVYYFYQKALEEAEEGERIEEENYRYPGPKPQTRETAITMLADSVEGATRALSEPTPGKIEETVHKIINNKFIDGQLDECNLTLKDIERISSTFIRILSAMYHGRVKYPEKKNHSGGRPESSADKTRSESKDAGHNHKSSEKNPTESRPNSKNHKQNPQT